MYKFIRQITPLLLLLASLAMSANNSYRFIHITGNEGLSHQQVEHLMQDHKGEIWIGTRNGLQRYNGYEIISYFNDINNPNSLPHNTITALFEDSRKRIWVATDKGVCQFRPESNDFNVITGDYKRMNSIIETSSGKIVFTGQQLAWYDEENQCIVNVERRPESYIIASAIDSNDNIFVASNTSIMYYDTSLNQATQINSEYFSDFLTGFDGIVPLFFDSRGRLWVGRNGDGVMWIDLAKGTSKIYRPDEISDGTVRKITEDKSHRIWLGTEKGLTIINPDESIEIIRQNFVDKNKLNDNAVYDILCDRDGNIWVGTYFGGINVLPKKNELFNWIEPGYGNNNLRGKAIRKIIEPVPGTLWIASEDGGLNILDTATGQIDLFNKIPSLGHNIHDIFLDNEMSTIWIGTFRNGLFTYNLRTHQYNRYLPKDNTGIPSDAVFQTVKQHNGTIWVGTTQGLRKFDPETKSVAKPNHPALDFEFIYCMLVDNNDNVWVGTRNFGLFCIDSSTNEIIEWGENSFTDKYITCLFQSDDGTIWIGTNNNGVQFIDKNSQTPTHLTLDVTLLNCTVCNIIADNSNCVWFSTNQGLYRYNRTRNEITRFTAEDGIPSNQFNFASGILASNGMLYFGSVNGLISFNPAMISTHHQQFDVHLRRLTIDDIPQTSLTDGSPLVQNIDDTESITLSYNQSRSFSIEYAVVAIGSSNSINYQVRLVGVDKEWRNVGTERKFVGSNLSPGKYTLQIRANNTNIGWDEEPTKQITIVIRPPFYQSGWAYTLYLIVIALAIILAIRIANARIKDRNDVKIANLQKEKLEEINQLKLDFFTTVSHELKTPLSLIMVPLKYIAQHYTLQSDASEKLDAAIKNTEKMVGLIDELVTFNKMESGTFRFYIQKGNPVQFVANIVQLFSEIISESQLQLYTHFEDNGEEVWFSPAYVERIVNNLMSNAIKFTSPGGKISVSASIFENGDSFTHLRIAVADTGIGIAAEEQQNIFARYYQTKRGHNKSSKGWGLGLALVQKLATIHKGSVAVQSTIGVGSTFTVDLNVSAEAFDETSKIAPDKMVIPIERYEYTTPALVSANASKPAKPDSNPLFSILLVEDNEEMLQLLADIFSPNYNIFTATNGKEALDIALTEPINLVISDVMMPIMDGNELCKRLKGNVTTSHIPVILLTAKNDTKDVMEGYESGAEAYVQKPFDPAILELQVNNAIKARQELREKIFDQKEPDADDLEHLSKFDKEFIDQINDIIEQNIGNDHFSIADITEKLCISRSLLHMKMKTLLDISTGDYIRKKRLAHACSLLAEGYNVSETAYKTGFSDPNYFSKTFKKEFGVTPTEYHNQQQQLKNNESK